MPTTATIVAAWQDDQNAYLAVRVGDIEYIGAVPRTADFDKLSTAQKKAALTAAASDARAARQTTVTDLPISGTVTI